MAKFAVFDIDGTLIRWQLYHVLVDKLAKTGALGPDTQDRLSEARMTWKKRDNPDAFKAYEKELIELYEDAILNVPASTVDSLIEDIIEEYRDQVYTYTRDLARQLKKDGYFLLVISGSHHELVEKIAEYYGFDDYVGTLYERQDTGFSGQKHIASRNKASELKKLTDKHGLEYSGSIAIGDSGSDIAMLELVEFPIAFNPDRILFDAAKNNGWKIVIERKNMVYELEANDGRYVLV